MIKCEIFRHINHLSRGAGIEYKPPSSQYIDSESLDIKYKSYTDTNSQYLIKDYDT